MFSSCNPKFFAVRNIHYPVNTSSDHFHTDAVVPSSDHCRTQAILPPSGHGRPHCLPCGQREKGNRGDRAGLG